jgi:phosphoglycolate phosphatase-like HAD superfamily hydrolase
MLRAVFLDFDGVIKESLDIKTAAFAAFFAPWGEEVVRQVCAHHTANGGMSRYRKLPLYLREYCKMEAGAELDALVEKLLTDFADRVVEEVVAAPYVPSAELFIGDCNKQGIPLAIVSGTPDEEMRTIVGRMGRSADFARIYGSPRDKNELLALALQDLGCAPEDVFFVGDSINDYLPAKAAGVPFIARVAPSLDDPFPEDVYRITDFTGWDARGLYKNARI